jgi:hypothetical protein
VHEVAGDRYSVVCTIPIFFGGRKKIESPLSNPPKLRFGWDGLDVAMLRPEAVP